MQSKKWSIFPVLLLLFMFLSNCEDIKWFSRDYSSFNGSLGGSVLESDSSGLLIGIVVLTTEDLFPPRFIVVSIMDKNFNLINDASVSYYTSINNVTPVVIPFNEDMEQYILMIPAALLPGETVTVNIIARELEFTETLTVAGPVSNISPDGVLVDVSSSVSIGWTAPAVLPEIYVITISSSGNELYSAVESSGSTSHSVDGGLLPAGESDLSLEVDSVNGMDLAGESVTKQHYLPGSFFQVINTTSVLFDS